VKTDLGRSGAHERDLHDDALDCLLGAREKAVLGRRMLLTTLPPVRPLHHARHLLALAPPLDAGSKYH
jgi:hypothetical protein